MAAEPQLSSYHTQGMEALPAQVWSLPMPCPCTGSGTKPGDEEDGQEDVKSPLLTVILGHP